MKDERLMVEYQRGNEDAFTKLYTRNHKHVSNWARRVVRLSERQDATQLTWIRVVQFKMRYDAAHPFRPWLYMLCQQASYRVAKGRHEMLSLEGENLQPESRKESIGFTDEMRAALTDLPEDQRYAIVGSFFDAKSVRQLAIEMGLTSKIVRGIKRKALASLSAKLGNAH